MEMWHKVELPSKGRAGYDPVVEIRPLKTREIKAFTGLVSPDTDTRFTELLRAVMRNGPAPEELTIGDREYLLLCLRIDFKGKLVEFEGLCPFCGRQAKRELDLTTVPVKELEVDEEMIEYPEVDGSTKTVKAPFLRGRHYMFAETVGATDDRVTVAVAFALGGHERYKYFLDLPASWFLKVLDVYKKYEHGPIWDEAPVKCECGGDLPFPFLDFLAA